MMHQKRGFRDKYLAPLLITLLLAFCGTANAQVYQSMPNRYNIREARFDSSLELPFGTTPSLRSSIQQTNPGRLFYKTSDSSVQVWTGTQWLNVGGGTAINWGDIGGTLSDQTDLWAALNARVKYTDTTLMLSKYLRSTDTAWLHNAVTTIKTTQDNTTFSDGLHKVGNNVVALHDEAHWNAYMFQGRFVSTASPLNGQVYAWDSVGLQWKPTTVTAGGTETDAIALAALIDSAAAIRADFPAVGGSTQTLQQVLATGSTLTTDNTIDGGNKTLVFQNDSVFYIGTNHDFNAEAILGSNIAGLQARYDWAQMYAGDGTNNQNVRVTPTNFFWNSDTVATRAWVRSILGGGSGTTPGLFDVIDMGQVGSGYKNIDMGAGGINFNNGTIQLSDYGGGTIVGDGLTYLAGFDQYGQFIEVDPATIGGGSAAPFDDVLAAGADITTSRTIGGTGTLTINPTTGAEIYSGSISGISSGLFATSTNETYMQAYDATNNNSAYVLVHTGTTAGDGGYIKIQATSSSTSTQHMIMVNEDYIEFINRTGTPEVLIRMKHLPVYDTEADAVTGGLAQNTVYKTSTGELRIKL